MKALPSGSEIVHQAVLLLAAAALAALIAGQFPQYKQWVRKQWE